MTNHNSPLFYGASTALITPFKSGKVDFDTLGRLIDLQIEGGISAIVVCGTTGESATMTPKEKYECIKFASKHVAGRIPVIAGSGSNCTKSSVELSMKAEEAGADGLLIVTPYYNKASSIGLIKHYTEISSRVSVPIILYNVPSRTGVDIPIEVYRELSLNESIVAVKEASGRVDSVRQIINECEGRLSVYTGNDNIVCESMEAGAIGCISVASNIIPRQMSDICHMCLSNETIIARNMQNDLSDIFDALFCEVNPIPLKYAMSAMGLCSDEIRLPLCSPAEENTKKIRTALESHSLI